MINLLPLEKKQELIFLKNRNLTMVLGAQAIIFLVCFALVLMSIKFYVLQNISYQKSVLKDAEDQYQTAEFLSVLDSLKKYNSELLKIDSFYDREISLSGALKSILSITRPSGVSFSNLVLEKAGAAKIKVNLYGASSTRDELLSFKSNIENKGGIDNVYLPPGDLIKPSNISFHLTFEVQTAKQ